MKMNKKNGISLIVLIITIIVIVILAGSAILGLVNNNPIEQATKANFLNDIRNLQTEAELYACNEYLVKLGTYDPTLLQANETSVTYNGEIQDGKTIYDIIPSLKTSTQYSGQVEIIDGKITYKGTDSNKQEWAMEVDIVLPASIVGGNAQTVALMLDGTVKAWGWNGNGQLGDGTTVNKSTPTSVPGLTDVKQIVTFCVHTLALLNDGTVKAWGYNGYGQLGDGTTVDKSVPTTVPGLTNVKQIIAGGYHTLALLNDGTVRAWGYNSCGQLGDGTTVSRSVPTVVPGLTDVKQIVAGDSHTIVLLNDGTVKAWGNNGNGQLGDGTTVNKSIPTLVQGLIDVKQIVAGDSHTIALLNDGTAKAWGMNYEGQLGDGTTVSRSTPILVPGLTDVKQIGAGSWHTIALLNNGTVKAWGYNMYGQLGDATTVDKRVPTLININDFDKIAPIVVYEQNGGNIPSLIVTATDKDGTINILQYVWSEQNNVAPTSGWTDFANGGCISRQNLDVVEYLWIKAVDTSNNTTVVKSNEFTALAQVTVNKPSLATGMVAKKWNGSSWDTVSNPDTDTSWYDYRANKWANAQTLDGSMWVWIPRYEYKIPTSHSNTAQTIAVNFLLNTQTIATSGYIIHPAFTFGSVELTGIWVAKFEASGSISAVAVKPGVTSLRSITIGVMFTACRNMETTYGSRYGWGTTGTGIDTHLMKNVEWGAVVYLANSKYGKNSEVWINPYYNWMTGQVGTFASSYGTNFTYNYDNILYGVNASTTGNIYGVYDMSGGAYEYTAAYINNGNASLTTYGSSLVSASSQYKDVYIKGANDDMATNYAVASGKFGDAVYETSNAGTNTTSGWYADLISMPYASGPFFLRGGAWGKGTNAGLFAVNCDNGNVYQNYGFRPVLAVSNEL